MESVETYVLDSNPVLEAFGNAKTVRNKNSSRFGKFMQVKIQTQSGNICSAKILTYLLEKSRAVSISDHERSYHIFYQGLASDEIRTKYQLTSGNPQDYNFLHSSTGTYQIEGVDDASDYNLTMACLRNLRFSEEEIDQIWQLLIAILHLGNVEYRIEESDDCAKITETSKKQVERSAELLQLTDRAKMFVSLESKVAMIGREEIVTPLQKD